MDLLKNIEGKTLAERALKYEETRDMQVINEARLPMPVVQEAKRIARELGECYHDFDDKGDPIMTPPKSVEIMEFHPEVGINLKIIRSDGLEQLTSISPRKVAEWEKKGWLNREK